ENANGVYDEGVDTVTDTETIEQTFTVKDNVAPVFDDVADLPDNITISSCDALPTAPTLTATDNCSTTTVTLVQTVNPRDASGTFYTVVRVWTAKDACDNETTHTQTITVNVPIVTEDDGFGPIDGKNGSTDLGNVLTNDLLSCGVPSVADVTLKVGGTEVTTPVSFPGAVGVQLRTDGTVSVAPSTPAGTYTLDYTICEIANPLNCSSVATV